MKSRSKLARRAFFVRTVNEENVYYDHGDENFSKTTLKRGKFKASEVPYGGDLWVHIKAIFDRKEIDKGDDA